MDKNDFSCIIAVALLTFHSIGEHTMLTSLTRDLFIILLSRFMEERGLVCNIKIMEDHLAETITVGGQRTLTPFTIVFYQLRHFCVFAASPRVMTFGKLYIDGYVNIQGDWFAAARFIHELNDQASQIEKMLLGFLAPTQTVETHYGWSAEAFAFFLDHPHMQYTCGKLEHGDDQISLEESQLNKLRLIAKWIHAKPGKLHLDVGCGWGGLIHYLTQHHGMNAHGLTLSQEQASYAISCQPHPAQFHVTSFEEHNPSWQYDTATVVGMLEHVPIDQHAWFFARLAELLKSKGRAYLQCITRSTTRPIGDRTRFLKEFVFAHELNTLPNLTELAHQAGFAVMKVEESHLDYAFTTRQWVERLRDNETEVRSLLKDDRVYRTLLGYLTMGSLSFEQHHSNLHRLLLVKK